MFCGKCNCEIVDGSRFCTSCGAPIELNLASVQPAVNAAPAENGYSAEVRQYAAPVQNAGYAQTYAPAAPSGYAAVGVKEKKKSSKKPLIITLVSIIAVLAIGAVIYFTNSAAILSTFMGKSNYAAMIEGNSIKQMSTKLDTAFVSNNVKTLTGVYHIASSNGIDPESYTAFLSNNAGGSAGLSEFFGLLNDSIKDTYGVNSVMFTLEMNVDLSNAAKTELKKELGISDYQLEQLLGYINSAKVSSGVTANESSAAFTAEIEADNSKINAKLLINDKGELYLVLPFASEKALFLDLGDYIGEFADTGMTFSGSSSSDDLIMLDLNEKELDRFINELVEIYIDCYKDSEIEMENGSLDVMGVSVSGKVLTAEFNGEMLENLMKSIVEKFAADEYFKGEIVGYLRRNGVMITEEDYENAILSVIPDIKINAQTKLKITTVINNSGSILGKSYQMEIDGETVELSYAESGNDAAYELKTEIDGETVSVSMAVDGSSSTDGVATAKLEIGNEEIAAITVKYKNADVKKFCGKETYVGSYEINISLSEMITGDSYTSDVIKNITLLYSCDVSKNTCTTTVGVRYDELGEVSVTCAVTAENNTSDLNKPTSVIDVEPYLNGKDLDSEMMDYIQSVLGALTKMSGVGFGGYGGIGGYGGLTGIFS